MKLYRVSMSTVKDSSLGFEWFSSMRFAEERAAGFKRMMHKNGEQPETEIKAFEFEPTQQDIKRLLNLVASHPDNG